MCYNAAFECGLSSIGSRSGFKHTQLVSAVFTFSTRVIGKIEFGNPKKFETVFKRQRKVYLNNDWEE